MPEADKSHLPSTALHAGSTSIDLALDASGVGLFEYDSAAGVQRFSERARQIWGLAADQDPTPDLIHSLVHPADRHRVAIPAQSLHPRGPGEFSIEHRIVRPDGAIRWVQARGRTVFEGTGASRRGLRSVGTMMDITEQKQIEIAARASEARQAFMLQLNDRLRTLTDPQAIQFESACILGEHLQANRVGYTEDQADDNIIRTGRHYTHGVAALEGHYRFEDYGFELLIALREGRIVVRSDIVADPALTDAQKVAYAALELGSIINVPLVKNGHLVAVLFVHFREAHDPSVEEIALLEQVAARTWDAVERARAEAALRASEARFRGVQETSIDGFMVLESARDAAGSLIDFRWLYANAAAGRLVGRDASWFPQRLLLEEMPGNRPSGLFDGYVRVVETGIPWSTECHYTHDGLDVYLRLHVARVGDGFAVTFADLTERRQAEQRIRESDERLRIALDAAHAGAFDWNLLTQQIYWTDGHFTLLGLEPGAQRPSYELWRGHVHVDDLVRVEAAIQRSIETRTRYVADYRVVSPEGSERWVQGQGLVLCEADRPVRMIGAIVDVTGRKRAEESHAAREAEFRTLADAIPTLAWMAHPDGWIFWYNQRWFEYTGMRPEQIEGWGWEAVHDPAELPGVKAAWQASIASGTPFEMTFPLRGSDGVFRPFLTRVVPVRDAQGRVIRWFGTNTDVSSERDTRAALLRSEAALRDADRRKDEFLATLSHELRNPLAPIRTATQLLANPKLSTAQLSRAQSIIQRQVTHMALLLDDLLDIARITQGKLELKKQPVSLTSVVDASLEAVRPLLESKNHHFNVTLPAETLLLNADPLRASQVVSNLLTNAIKYTDPGGDIELTASVNRPMLTIEVKDNGIGISPSALQRLFTMFTQLEGAAGRSEGGLGIGLALTKGLVELHGGTIEARSEGVGRGTTVVVHWPLGVASNVIEVTSDADVASLTTLRRRILIVDDNKDAADTLAMLLTLSEHEVRVAHSGSTALSLARTFRPEVGILDIGMPDMNGYELAGALRQEPWAAHIHLIAVTGWGQEEDKRQAEEAGFDSHLTKPVDPVALEAQIAGLEWRR